MEAQAQGVPRKLSVLGSHRGEQAAKGFSVTPSWPAQDEGQPFGGLWVEWVGYCLREAALSK